MFIVWFVQGYYTKGLRNTNFQLKFGLISLATNDPQSCKVLFFFGILNKIFAASTSSKQQLNVVKTSAGQYHLELWYMDWY